MLAAKGDFERTTIDEELRDFFNDETANFPSDLKIFIGFIHIPILSPFEMLLCPQYVET